MQQSVMNEYFKIKLPLDHVLGVDVTLRSLSTSDTRRCGEDVGCFLQETRRPRGRLSSPLSRLMLCILWFAAGCGWNAHWSESGFECSPLLLRLEKIAPRAMGAVSGFGHLSHARRRHKAACSLDRQWRWWPELLCVFRGLSSTARVRRDCVALEPTGAVHESLFARRTRTTLHKPGATAQGYKVRCEATAWDLSG